MLFGAYFSKTPTSRIRVACNKNHSNSSLICYSIILCISCLPRSCLAMFGPPYRKSVIFRGLRVLHPEYIYSGYRLAPKASSNTFYIVFLWSVRCFLRQNAGLAVVVLVCVDPAAPHMYCFRASRHLQSCTTPRKRFFNLLSC